MYRFHKSPGPNGLGPFAEGRGQTSLNLRLTGFSRQSHFSLDEIVRAIDRLPVFHLAGLREIEYLTREEADAYLWPESRAAVFGHQAEFVQRERRIAIFGVEERDLFFQVLFHEIGHYVYFVVISSGLKQYWATQVYPGSPCVTRYGIVNAMEDFAESYACYIRDPERLQAIPEKYSFLHHLVFSGAPVTLKSAEATLGGPVP